MNITNWPIGNVIPYARNARIIPQQAVDKIASSIREFGWRQPIVVDREGVIICGHARLLAAQKLGLAEVPVHVADNLTSAQVRAYRLLDNRSHQETDWNESLLGIELLELKDLGLDLSLTGFDFREIDKLICPLFEGQTDEDAIPDAPEKPVSRPGDLWIAGDHRILCGDSLEPGSIELVLGGEVASMVFTDPPYNVDYHQTSHAGRKIENDNLGIEFHEFLLTVCRNLLCVTRGAIYICMSSSELDVLKKAFIEAGGHWSTFIVWAKNTFTLGRSDYQRQYEPILYGWKEGEKHYWSGARDQGDVWSIHKPLLNDLHPTMKPVDLVVRAISNSSTPGATVLDTFGGSGTTVIAAEKTGRHARVIEVDPRYVDVAVKRWQDLTGKGAVLKGSDETFDAVSEVRERVQVLSEPTIG